MSHRILAVVGTRPNFVKVAPVLQALRAIDDVDADVLHTGQHYDRSMSDAILEQLDFPPADYQLGVGSGTHAEQTAGVLVGVERVLSENAYDAVLVPGDVNSTLAAALAAAKLLVPVIHLEAGLRSGDWTMPEEINRVLCDRLAAVLLCHSGNALENLAAEGIPESRAHLVGNTMVDSLLRLLPLARERRPLERYGLESQKYVVVTLHRPALVDDRERMRPVVEALGAIAADYPVVFPVHPRVKGRLPDTLPPGLMAMEPLGYLDFIALEEQARLVITDSGGVQEETSALGVACITYRTATERPVTVTEGTNRLVGLDPDELALAARDELSEGSSNTRPAIHLWDGAAGRRAARVIAEFLSR